MSMKFHYKQVHFRQDDHRHNHSYELHMTLMASNIRGSNVWSTACSDQQRRKHQSSALLGPCVGDPPVIVGFSAQRVSKADSVSMSWHHHSSMDRSSSYVGLCQVSFLFIEKEKWVIKTDQSWCKVVMAPAVVMYQWYQLHIIAGAFIELVSYGLLLIHFEINEYITAGHG